MAHIEAGQVGPGRRQNPATWLVAVAMVGGDAAGRPPRKVLRRHDLVGAERWPGRLADEQRIPQHGVADNEWQQQDGSVPQR